MHAGHVMTINDSSLKQHVKNYYNMLKIIDDAYMKFKYQLNNNEEIATRADLSAAALKYQRGSAVTQCCGDENCGFPIQVKAVQCFTSLL